jgi:hypothetical protein
VHTFSRFIYFDTNALSLAAKDPALWPTLINYLTTNDLTIAVGTAQVAELADATRLHSSLAQLLTQVPSALLKTPGQILSEEVAAHPSVRKETLLLYPLNALLAEPDGPRKLQQYLSSGALASARALQKALGELAPARHSALKANFPPPRSGTYTANQAGDFESAMVMQWLAKLHRPFLESFRNDASELRTEIFLSLRLFGLVIFFKYYLGRRQPATVSDFGDLGHSFFLPYCRMAILERDLGSVLKQIKRHCDVLTQTEIHTVELLRRLK